MTAVCSDEGVFGSSKVRNLEEWMHELERLLGRLTMEVWILRKAIAKARVKINLAANVAG